MNISAAAASSGYGLPLAPAPGPKGDKNLPKPNLIQIDSVKHTKAGDVVSGTVNQKLLDKDTKKFTYVPAFKFVVDTRSEKVEIQNAKGKQIAVFDQHGKDPKIEALRKDLKNPTDGVVKKLSDGSAFVFGNPGDPGDPRGANVVFTSHAKDGYFTEAKLNLGNLKHEINKDALSIMDIDNLSIYVQHNKERQHNIPLRGETEQLDISSIDEKISAQHLQPNVLTKSKDFSNALQALDPHRKNEWSSKKLSLDLFPKGKKISDALGQNRHLEFGEEYKGRVAITQWLDREAPKANDTSRFYFDKLEGSTRTAKL